MVTGLPFSARRRRRGVKRELLTMHKCIQPGIRGEGGPNMAVSLPDLIGGGAGPPTNRIRPAQGLGL